jgi:hypothetical protein
VARRLEDSIQSRPESLQHARLLLLRPRQNGRHDRSLVLGKLRSQSERERLETVGRQSDANDIGVGHPGGEGGSEFGEVAGLEARDFDEGEEGFEGEFFAVLPFRGREMGVEIFGEFREDVDRFGEVESIGRGFFSFLFDCKEIGEG